MAREPIFSLADEAAVLGACLFDAALAGELRRDWFYHRDSQAAYDAIAALAEKRAPVESTTLIDRLTEAGVTEAVAIVNRLIEACPSAACFAYHAGRLRDCLTRRRIVGTAQAAIGAACEQGADASRVLEDFEREALAIRSGQGADSAGEVDLRAVLLGLTHEYEAAMRGEAPAGIRTGFSDLDRLLGPLKPGQLIIVAARPSVGKTALALNIAEHVAFDAGVPVGFFSLEMSASELLHRLVCGRARIESNWVNGGELTERELARMAEVATQIPKAPLHICDRGGLSLGQLTGYARRMLQRYGIRLLVVDYLGLLRSGEKGRSRYEDITTISNALKTLAKDLAVPAIVLAQLNRASVKETRGPILSDLRDSGAIEQDADAVALLHRPEDATGEVHPVELTLAKNRTGPVGRIGLVFHRRFTRFDSAAKGAVKA